MTLLSDPAYWGSGQDHIFALRAQMPAPGVVCIFVSNGAVADLFRAVIADIGCPVKAVAALLLKILTGLITGGAGSTFDAA